MRIFALSDLHVDYRVNADWVADISMTDYRDDILILAGDVAHTLQLLDWCLSKLTARFKTVLFVPGNHDLYIINEDAAKTSIEKFSDLLAVMKSSGASMDTFSKDGVSIVPLLGWYDYSFGEPSEELRSTWTDYRACRWPPQFGIKEIAGHFAALNASSVAVEGDMVITFSHFLPRIDVMPRTVPDEVRILYPVLGTTLLEQQLRRLGSRLHVYGHSHLNRKVDIDGVSYINNAFGYPYETRIAAKRLLCIHEF